MSNQTVNIAIKATPGQIEYLKEYTRDLGYKDWMDYLKEAALSAVPSEAEIQEIEKQ